jgi:hypothetical protein
MCNNVRRLEFTPESAQRCATKFISFNLLLSRGCRPYFQCPKCCRTFSDMQQIPPLQISNLSKQVPTKNTSFPPPVTPLSSQTTYPTMSLAQLCVPPLQHILHSKNSACVPANGPSSLAVEVGLESRVCN